MGRCFISSSPSEEDAKPLTLSPQPSEEEEEEEEEDQPGPPHGLNSFTDVIIIQAVLGIASAASFHWRETERDRKRPDNK